MNKPKISIICMVYQSIEYADWVYESVMKYTPMIETGEAEFLFVANDPTLQLVNHLKDKKYPFVLALHKSLSAEELTQLGYDSKYEYLHRVYTAWNQAILYAKGKMICLLNSDNFVSPDWLENLLKYSDFDKFVVPVCVEPKEGWWCSYTKDFGRTPSTFREDDFIAFCDSKRTTGLRPSGVYQPCLFYKDMAIYAGLYPQGNLINPDGTTKATGDNAFFTKLRNLGVAQVAALDSLVYHMHEGEMRTDEKFNPELYELIEEDKKRLLPDYVPIKPVENFVNIGCKISRDDMVKTQEIIDKLLIKPDMNFNSVFRNYADKISEGKAKKICIYPNGGIGRNVFLKMWEQNDFPDFYCDNDKTKHFTYRLPGNILCIPYEELLKIKNETLVIVASLNSKFFLEQLEKDEFPFFVDFKEILGILE